MTRFRRIVMVVFVACVLVFGCVVSSGPPSSGTSGGTSGATSGGTSGSATSGGTSGLTTSGGTSGLVADEPLTADETDTADRGNSSVAPLQAAAELADSIFDFDPTIDPTKTIVENATRIRDNITVNLGGGVDAGPKCGTVTLTDPATVTVVFGPPPGCTLVKGLTASGTAAASVTRNAGTTTVTLTLTALVVNGIDLAGKVSLATTTGSSFEVSGSLTSGGKTLTMTDLTIAGATGTITVGGTVSLSGNGLGMTSINFRQVAWKFGDCYPNSGSLTARRGLITMTVAFTSTTATTGQVTVTVGKKKSTQSLPPYGKCGRDGG